MLDGGGLIFKLFEKVMIRFYYNKTALYVFIVSMFYCKEVAVFTIYVTSGSTILNDSSFLLFLLVLHVEGMLVGSWGEGNATASVRLLRLSQSSIDPGGHFYSVNVL